MVFVKSFIDNYNQFLSSNQLTDSLENYLKALRIARGSSFGRWTEEMELLIRKDGDISEKLQQIFPTRALEKLSGLRKLYYDNVRDKLEAFILGNEKQRLDMFLARLSPKTLAAIQIHVKSKLDK